MKLLDFLRTCRQDLWNTKVKLIRHVDDKYDLDLLLRSGCFDEYQARQGSPVFNCDHIVSFLGESGTRSRFLGVWKILGVHKDGKETPYSSAYPYPDMGRPTYRYELQAIDGFEVLQNRLVIDWGDSARAWHQWLSSKTDRSVIELRPRGFVREFSGYDDIHLRYDELKQIIDNPDAHRLWHTMLGGVAGVYLIVDGTNGDQYIGSAYGASGILGRWKVYAINKHGGNKRLKELVTLDPDRHGTFSFSILRTLSRSLTAKEVIAIEGHFKKSLAPALSVSTTTERWLAKAFSSPPRRYGRPVPSGSGAADCCTR